MDQAGGSYIKNVGIAILDVLLELANKEMNIFKNFIGVDVPTNQPRSSASTQGINITITQSNKKSLDSEATKTDKEIDKDDDNDEHDDNDDDDDDARKFCLEVRQPKKKTLLPSPSRSDMTTSSHNLSRYFVDKHDSVVTLLGASRWGTERGDVLRDILTLRTRNLTQNTINNY
ncbi:hypothetical protein Tco_1362991 [Tanacetum coccineum]